MQFKSILFASLIAVAASQNVAFPQPAIPYTDNPSDKQYIAKFEGKKVTGSIIFTAGKGGKGVDFAIDLKGFEGEQGPFGYHIHDQPVPADGNCTLTRAHLDPFGRGQATPCDSTKPETCEVGDLAGKHGKIPASTSAQYGYVEYKTTYNDLYATLKEGVGAFLGNRSIVIHRPDASRLACVNIVPYTDDVEEYPEHSEHSEHSSSADCSSSATITYYGAESTGTSTHSYGNSSNPTHSAPYSTGSVAPVETSSDSGSATSFGLSPLVAVGGLIAGLMAAL